MTDDQTVAIMAAIIASSPAIQNLDADDAPKVVVAIAREILGEAQRTRPERPKVPFTPPTPRPVRTGYRDLDGVYHPAPDTPEYDRHCAMCAPCAKEKP